MLTPCWEIKKCGRKEGGDKVKELGVCVAYPNNGHSCWIIAGTFYKGEVQGTFAKKEKLCVICEVYKLYSTFFGEKKEQLAKEYPEEFEHCDNFFKEMKKEKTEDK
ncbi:MAG: hypothetical protein L0958_06535 [Candidatus Mariimomonas ferrooxydans]